MLDLLVVADAVLVEGEQHEHQPASASTQASEPPVAIAPCAPTDAAACQRTRRPGGIIDRARPAFETEPFRHQEQRPAPDLGEDAPHVLAEHPRLMSWMPDA